MLALSQSNPNATCTSDKEDMPALAFPLFSMAKRVIKCCQPVNKTKKIIKASTSFKNKHYLCIVKLTLPIQIMNMNKPQTEEKTSAAATQQSTNNFRFPFLNPLIHSSLRLKIMVTLSNIGSADFMYLCKITESTRGNVSTQLTTLKEAGYIEITKSGVGCFACTTCTITEKGRNALHSYEDSLYQLFTESVPEMEEKATKRKRIAKVK